MHFELTVSQSIFFRSFSNFANSRRSCIIVATFQMASSSKPIRTMAMMKPSMYAHTEAGVGQSETLSIRTVIQNTNLSYREPKLSYYRSNRHRNRESRMCSHRQNRRIGISEYCLVLKGEVEQFRIWNCNSTWQFLDGYYPKWTFVAFLLIVLVRSWFKLLAHDTRFVFHAFCRASLQK